MITLKKELIDNYTKGKFNKEHEIISCGAGEMERFIKNYIQRLAKRRKAKTELKMSI